RGDHLAVEFISDQELAPGATGLEHQTGHGAGLELDLDLCVGLQRSTPPAWAKNRLIDGPRPEPRSTLGHRTDTSSIFRDTRPRMPPLEGRGWSVASGALSQSSRVTTTGGS